MDAVEHATPGAQKPHTKAVEILNFKESIEEKTSVKAVLVRLEEKHPFLTHERARDLSRTRNIERNSGIGRNLLIDGFNIRVSEHKEQIT